MKILMVAIPNHHFFQWVNQLKDAGYEVHWFDVTDGAGFSNKISWVRQYNDWKLKWDFPFRSRIKHIFPKLYTILQKFNERKVETEFEKILNKVQPDIVHSFEMQLAGLPIFPIMIKNKIPWIYSSWGSDVFYFQELGMNTSDISAFLNRINYLITDCKRDYKLLQKLGYQNEFLGIFPGNGGINFVNNLIKPINKRKYILVKGYEDGVGKANIVLKAFTNGLGHLISKYQIVIFSADKEVVEYIRCSRFFNEFQPIIFPRNEYISNEKILELMGQSVIYIGNSISDGMPNTLLEAMGMGAFPIQSNPGNVTEEVITNNQNGFIIENPLDEEAIAQLIKNALANEKLLLQAQQTNIKFIQENYSRSILQEKIVSLYNQIVP